MAESLADVITNLSMEEIEEVDKLERTPSSPYEGQDIDLTKDQIRLLDILPGSRGDPLVCTSYIVHLSDKPSYTALSYVWGDASDRLSIAFNNEPAHPITRNLHTALQYLRPPVGSPPTTFWIDALCINQAHDDEKPHQIQLMGEIYKSATHTSIWLGPESPTSDFAMSLIRDLDGTNLCSPHNSPSPSGLRAIAELQARPWWSRVWVIQEALLSPNPTVHCGDSTLPMEAFMVLDDIRRGWHRQSGTYLHTESNSITSLSIPLRNPFSGIITYWPDARERLLSPTPPSNPSTLSEWAQYLSDFNATDPRDKIYGLLGLATATDRQVMRHTLERNSPASQVYTRAVAWFLRTERELLQLSFDADSRAGSPVGETGGTLPSWVVDFSGAVPEDWDEGKGAWFRPGYVPFLFEKKYNAVGRGDLLGRKIQEEMFPFGGVPALVVKGMVVDRVVYASGIEHLRPYGTTDAEGRMAYSLERIRATVEKVVEWEAEAMKPGWEDSYSGVGPWEGMARKEVFRRAVVANRNGSGLELDHDEEWDTMFDVLLNRKEMPLETCDRTPSDQERLQYLLPMRLALLPRTAGRNFIITSKGYFGLAPLKSRPGDDVCVLEGGTTPFVLRAVQDSELGQYGMTPKERQRVFKLVGECYVHGVSDGEWIDGQKKEDVIEVAII